MKDIVLVTGASGHIGCALVKKLKEEGEYVRVLIRSKSCLEYIGEYVDEVVYGDITSFEDCLEATKDVSCVFHSAALITVGREYKKEVYKINVEGTNNVVQACLKNYVKRLVYVSSAHALPFKNKKEVIHEQYYINPKKVKGHYAKSKAISFNNVMNVDQDLLETIIVLPTAVIGPLAYKDSHFNAFLEMYSKKKLRIYLKGHYNFIDVRDTVDAIYKTMSVDKKKEVYILSGKLLTIKEMFKSLEPRINIKAPKVKIPLPVLRVVAPFCELYYKAFHKKPLFTPHVIYTLNSNANFDNSKAIEDLGLNVRDVGESLYDHYRFVVK